jgi:ABC-type transport system involved in multi-copper enzyme maturation permease subunit
MKAMLLKDLLLIRRQYAKLLLILFICILAGSIISIDLTSVYLPFIAFFICSLALSTFSMDENNHGYQTILSFPIQRKAYIQSKYLLFLLLFLLHSFVFTGISAFLSRKRSLLAFRNMRCLSALFCLGFIIDCRFWDL